MREISPRAKTRRILDGMHARLFIPAGLLAAAAVAVIRALATRHGVGVGEYAAGSLTAGLFLLGALRLSRQALR